MRDEEDGNICIEDDIAVYFDLGGNQGSTCTMAMYKRSLPFGTANSAQCKRYTYQKKLERLCASDTSLS